MTIYCFYYCLFNNRLKRKERKETKSLAISVGVRFARIGQTQQKIKLNTKAKIIKVR